jgi:hypothetical protein
MKLQWERAPGAENVLQIISEHSEKAGSCQIWTARLDVKGYPAKWFQGKLWKVHRLIFTLSKGPIPARYDVHHKCENKACVKLEHLELIPHGKHASLSNMKNPAIGWGKSGSGERNGNYRFSKKEMEKAFLLRKEGLSQQKIASIIGCTQTHISRFLAKKTWHFRPLPQ